MLHGLKCLDSWKATYDGLLKNRMIIVGHPRRVYITCGFPLPPMHISRNRTLDEWLRWYIKKIGINFLDKWGCSIDGFLTLTRYWDVFILRTHSRTMILSGASLLTFLYYLLLICSFLYIRHRIYYRLWIWNGGQGVLRWVNKNTKTPLNMWKLISST